MLENAYFELVNFSITPSNQRSNFCIINDLAFPWLGLGRQNLQDPLGVRILVLDLLHVLEELLVGVLQHGLGPHVLAKVSGTLFPVFAEAEQGLLELPG